MKESRYNFKVNYNDYILIYNAITDGILPLKKDEYSRIKQIVNGDINSYPILRKYLIKQGFYVDSEIQELESILLNRERVVDSEETYKITINPTLDCNLKCWYCSVAAEGAKEVGSIMSNDIVESLKSHLSYIANSKKYKAISLTWFGGEPLLYFKEVMLPILQFVKTACDENNLGYSNTITTNAFLIDTDVIDVIKQYNFVGFQITIDGNEKKHNTIRNENGSGTFSTIVENIAALSDFSDVLIRINYDNQTLRDIVEIIPYLSKVNKTNTYIAFHKVLQINVKENNEELNSSIREFEDAGFNVLHWNFRPKRNYTCMYDFKNNIVVNYDGNIYKCTARSYSKHERVGSLVGNEIVFNNLYDSLYKIQTLKECKECKYLPICNGPCIQKRYEYMAEGFQNFSSRCIKLQAEFKIEDYIVNKFISLSDEH